MKRLILILLLMAATVNALEYKEIDNVKGGNLELTKFIEDLDVIQDLIESDMIKRNYNRFSGSFSAEDNGAEYTCTADNLIFKGRVSFDDKSSISYELKDFSVEHCNLDEASTSVEGSGILTYEAMIVIKREVPVDAVFDFYSYGDDFFQEVFIDSDDTEIHFENGDNNYFRHRKKCYGVDCLY